MEKYLYKSYVPCDLTDISFLEKVKPFSLIEQSIKILFEYTISIGLLLITSPVMLYAVYKIKKDSPGPVLFKQKRVGKNGKEFECIKFRSMHLDAEKDGAKFATEDDDRIYPWGKFMRTTRIDELPQLWNVLRGDMHLVGPRPERKVWIEQFEKEIPYYNERHIIKPGLTGWAQVLYPYGANAYDAQQKLMYDLYYIKHWSLWLEAKTIWKTVMVVLYRKGV
jgi:exopolysaccharide biosynthesis polyprenyl glycosylphosphotransferase